MKLGSFHLIWREDRKNRDFISSRGLTIKEAIRTIHLPVIRKLTYKNYCSGPEKDRKLKNCHVWVFGVEIDNKEIYIKLSDNFKRKLANGISFHEAEHPLKYPHKK